MKWMPSGVYLYEWLAFCACVGWIVGFLVLVVLSYVS